MAQVPALKYADGDVMDYTPSGANVAAGDVVVLGTRPLIAPSAIVVGEKGVLATTGIWKVPQKAEIQTAGNAVYWDTDGDPYGGTAGTGACTATASAGYLMGTVVETTAATDQYCKVEIRGVTGQSTVAGAVTADSLSITGTGGITLAGTTGQPHVTLTTNLADALSVKDSAGDLVVATTTTGSQRITITPPVTVTGAITATAGIVSTVAAVTADGSAQGDAVALTAGAMNVVADGDDTKGVILPTAATTAAAIMVLNSGTAGLKIYPASSDKINNGSANAAITILENTMALLVPTAADNWAAIYTVNS